MSTRKKPSNIVQRIVKQVWRFFQSLTKALINWFLRSLFLFNRRRSVNQAGFVLPTIVMVMLVVLLLTLSILFRSFNRPKNASNMRVDKATYAAAAPALDRARSKLQYLFSPEETGLKGNTPDDTSISEVFEGPKYTYGDETQLKLVADFNGQSGIQPEEKLQTAWKFPVDTDGNGKFDSYTLYGIYFRTPTIDPNNPSSARPRGPIEARTLPQDEGQLEGCGSGGNGGSGDGWTVQSNGQLKKSFFTYVATVPIKEATGLDATQYEAYKGNKSFSGLEMQQDQARIALDNNAVWYRNDLEIIDPTPLNLNGRVHTNGNLIVAGSDGDAIKFWQVSSPGSCFYKAENSKIQVGGNVIAGALTETDNRSNDLVQIDLFRKGASPTQTEYINSSNVTTKGSPAQAAANNEAYDLRLNLLVSGAINLHNLTTPAARKKPTSASVASLIGRFPQKEVIDKFNKKVEKCDPNCKDSKAVLENLIKRYFEARIRQVTNAEIPPSDSATAIGTFSPLPRDPNYVFSGGGIIAAPKDWMELNDSITKVPLNINGATMELDASKPTGNNTTETRIGDRILVGNGLPNQWLKKGTGSQEDDYAKQGEAQPIPGVNWNDGSGQRERRSSVQPVTEVDDTSRDGYWESAAAFTGTPRAENAQNPELLGGLRVITGAGIYVDGRGPALGGTGKRADESTSAFGMDVKSFLPSPPTVKQLQNQEIITTKWYQKYGIFPQQLIVVWPESMPSYQWLPADSIAKKNSDKNFDGLRTPGEGTKGDLQMKATVVYHYASDPNNPDRAPIACISSYYNNTDPWTADNANGISNNGINYEASGLVAQRTITPRLQRQARMIFPDGRLVNEPLKEALDSLKAGTPLSLSEIAALDAANCALNILDGSAPSTSTIPDGAIKENAFLDARQVKALHKSPKIDSTTGDRTVKSPTLLADITEPKQLEIAELTELQTLTAPPYDLPIEQRQPLEIRVTDIDLSATTGINRAYSGNEYLIPNSGIIYATRDDALADNSDPKGTSSATDFKLDPSRHANAIRLFNGQNLARVNTFRKEEKGLILASDLPVYIKGDFNLHAAPGGGSGAQIEEFNTALNSDYSNFYGRTRNDRNPNFACRQGGGQCGSTGDQWRAARILSDAVTIQSDNFNDGFRNDGDYDFNNNAGNVAVEPRLKNGFWWNSYATSADWYDTGSGKPKDFDTTKSGDQGSSYVMNDVTPIQRRTRFPAYLMEACLKKPVSACGPDDWFIGRNALNQFIKVYQFNPVTYNSLPSKAGTTADQPTGVFAGSVDPATGIFAGAVRRVAFNRGSYGQLVIANGFAQPIAANGAKLSYGGGGASTILTNNQKDNALWFWTTSDNTDPHPTTGAFPAQTRTKPSYNNDTLLYYQEALESVSERQLLLPGTPEFPYAKGTPPEAQKINLLNGTIAAKNASPDNASDYAVCMGDVSGKEPIGAPTGGPCLQLLRLGRIYPATQELLKLTDALIDGEKLVAVDKTTFSSNPTSELTLTLKAKTKVNVYDIAADVKLGNPYNLTIELENGNQSDPIFVFRKTAGGPLTFGNWGGSSGVTLNLKGVPPNNVFWVSNFGVRINSSANNQLSGNFLGTGNLNIAGTPTLEGVRFLGFRALGGTFPPSMKAMTSTDEPLLVPVLQLHSPAGTPNASPETAFGNDKLEEAGWLPTATPTNVNAVLVMGDSPSRVIPSINSAETGGGLQNFPRFMERWSGQGNRINGSLIQFRRSSFATAPFQAIDDTKTDTSLFFDGTVPDYTISTDQDYRYRGGSASRLAPFYLPPNRAWGYDVGLLSQSPDLFSKNFATPSAGSPNEYFREVGKDDEWIINLRCAVLKDDPSKRALGDAPASCPPLSSYSN